MSRKIVFSHRRAVGDTLMFTCGVRDFKLMFPDFEINVDSNFPQMFDNNPYLTRSVKKGGEGVEFHKVGYPIINNANAASTHFTQGFLLDMIAAADAYKPLPIKLHQFVSAFSNGRIGDPDIKHPDTARYKSQKDGGLEFMPEHLKKLFLKREAFCARFGRLRADIWMTKEEMKKNLVKSAYGVEKYWLIAPGGKRDCTTKIWDWRRFQDVVDYFDGQIKFVSIGRSDHLVEKLSNVIDLTDKFNKDLRGLVPLVYHSEGCVSGVTLLLHLAGGVPPKYGVARKPCVAIYGGREPITFTNYNTHQILHTAGSITCCDVGGCWHSRVLPLQKDPKKNRRLCKHPVESNGKTIPKCMDMITSEDVIRAIEIYYEGNIYKPMMPVTRPIVVRPRKERVIELRASREINLLASMKSSGGGEQSAAHIARLLEDAGWRVNFHPWASVDNKFQNNGIEFGEPFIKSKGRGFKEGLPLLFYANDQIGDFVKEAKPLIDRSSGVIVGVNFVNGPLPKATWMGDKLKAVVFQNQEKRLEFDRDAIGFDNTERVVLFGAIDLEKFIEVCPPQRSDGKAEMVVLKHCTPDYRKYVTEQSARGGEKIHIWQQKIIKETDVKFYTRLLKDVSNVRFEFMAAHPELVKAFANEERMTFHEWDVMSAPEFLARGHVYLYRTSNQWRDQYPRVVAEALAAGIPVLTEPRDGTLDRVVPGNTGFHCVDYDQFKEALLKLRRKESYRHQMGMYAKDWARVNLDPRRWVEIISEVL